MVFDPVVTRLKSLGDAIDRMSTRSRMVLHTSDPNKPTYITTHFDKDFACVQIANQSGGVSGPEHSHGAVEWIFVLSGVLNLTTADTSTKVPAGDSCKVMSGVMHTVETPEDTTYIMVTMPNILSELESVLGHN